MAAARLGPAKFVVETVTRPTPTTLLLACRRKSIADQDTVFEFKAGQWLDVFMPGTDLIGGYSICTTPDEYRRTGTLEIAVKHSAHPPTAWLHKQARQGLELGFNVGGSFSIDQPMQHPHLFVAGGIGITPLFAMAKHVLETAPALPIHLVYSCATSNDFLFKDRLVMLQKQHSDHFHISWITTRQEPQKRITEQLLASVLKPLEKQGKPVEAFLCGPPAMTKAVHQQLNNLDIGEEHIHYERWW